MITLLSINQCCSTHFTRVLGLWTWSHYTGVIDIADYPSCPMSKQPSGTTKCIPIAIDAKPDRDVYFAGYTLQL